MRWWWNAIALIITTRIAAQPAYRLGPDTLRYDERTTAQQTVQVGDRTSTMELEVAARLATILQRNARAWFEELKITRTDSTEGPYSPWTAPVIRQPFTFAFTSDGRVTIRRTPEVPDYLLGVYDVSLQFEDFFITLPRQPLAVGVTWMDTLIINRRVSPTRRYQSGGTRRYLVERDTVVNGVPAVLLRTTGAARINATDSREETTVRIEMEGQEAGLAIVTKDGSRLLVREREGRMIGTMLMTLGGLELTASTHGEYQSTVRLVTP
jgi:hypothetical protein